MKKVKIKTMPKTGTQKDYSLVHNTAVPASSNNTKESVRNTMTATNNGDENIEVENGETVIGDLNYDGLLELMSFQGKTHAEGGIPVNVPDGSFIYSNTPKMRIKDEDILKIFGMGKKKKGYTPAEISKQYQINDHIDTLKNEEADDISKKTAHQMLKNNTEKLAMLAIVQEGMKGFENGIPSFAENVMAGLQQGEGQPQMKYGGLPKFGDGGGDPPKDERKKNYTVVAKKPTIETLYPTEFIEGTNYNQDKIDPWGKMYDDVESFLENTTQDINAVSTEVLDVLSTPFRWFNAGADFVTSPLNPRKGTAAYRSLQSSPSSNDDVVKRVYGSVEGDTPPTEEIMIDTKNTEKENNTGGSGSSNNNTYNSPTIDISAEIEEFGSTDW